MGLIALNAAVAVRVIVRIEPTLFGPRTELDFEREPTK
jgi:hypothetical protein